MNKINFMIDQVKKFTKRYWFLIVLFIITMGLIFNNALFKFLGTLIYVPALSFLGVLVALLFRNVFNAESTDKYVDDGDYTKDFHSLSKKDKVWLTNIQFFIYLLFVALIILAAV